MTSMVNFMQYKAYEASSNILGSKQTYHFSNKYLNKDLSKLGYWIGDVLLST